MKMTLKVMLFTRSPVHSLFKWKLLITGGTGFFGKALLRYLLLHRPQELHVCVLSRDLIVSCLTIQFCLIGLAYFL